MKIGRKDIARTAFRGMDNRDIIGYSFDGFQVTVNKEGVEIQGKLFLEEHSELQEFAQLLGTAWTEHDNMVEGIRKALRAPPSGH